MGTPETEKTEETAKTTKMTKQGVRDLNHLTRNKPVPAPEEVPTPAADDAPVVDERASSPTEA